MEPSRCIVAGDVEVRVIEATLVLQWYFSWMRWRGSGGGNCHGGKVLLCFFIFLASIDTGMLDYLRLCNATVLLLNWYVFQGSAWVSTVRFYVNYTYFMYVLTYCIPMTLTWAPTGFSGWFSTFPRTSLKDVYLTLQDQNRYSEILSELHELFLQMSTEFLCQAEYSNLIIF